MTLGINPPTINSQARVAAFQAAAQASAQSATAVHSTVRTSSLAASPERSPTYFTMIKNIVLWALYPFIALYNWFYGNRIPAQVAPAQATSTQITPVQAPPVQTVPAQVGVISTTPAQVTPSQIIPVQIPPVQIVPSQVGATSATPTRAAPVQVPPVQITPVQTSQQRVPVLSSSQLLPNFYRGVHQNVAGFTLDEIIGSEMHRGWPDTSRIPGENSLETRHDYIQWLFPRKVAGAHNPQAPYFNEALREIFRRDAIIRRNVLRAFKRMLLFYGLRLDETTGQITRGANFAERFAQWGRPGDHNHLRISRILESLRLMDFEPLSHSLFNCLATIPGGISDDSRAAWRRYAFDPIETL